LCSHRGSSTKDHQAQSRDQRQYQDDPSKRLVIELAEQFEPRPGSDCERRQANEKQGQRIGTNHPYRRATVRLSRRLRHRRAETQRAARLAASPGGCTKLRLRCRRARSRRQSRRSRHRPHRPRVPRREPLKPGSGGSSYRGLNITRIAPTAMRRLPGGVQRRSSPPISARRSRRRSETARGAATLLRGAISIPRRPGRSGRTRRSVLRLVPAPENAATPQPRRCRRQNRQGR